MPYFPVGYPTAAESLDAIEALARNGADLIEVGVPFSDPLADGPVIQHATQIALHNGVTVGACLHSVAELRRRGVTVPLILMGYYNPISAFRSEGVLRCGACGGRGRADRARSAGGGIRRAGRCAGRQDAADPHDRAHHIGRTRAQDMRRRRRFPLPGFHHGRHRRARTIGAGALGIRRPRPQARRPSACRFALDSESPRPLRRRRWARSPTGSIVGTACVRAIGEVGRPETRGGGVCGRLPPGA